MGGRSPLSVVGYDELCVVLFFDNYMPGPRCSPFTDARFRSENGRLTFYKMYRHALRYMLAAQRNGEQRGPSIVT